MSKLLVIVGSTRPTRAADLVVPWLAGKAAGHEAFETEVVDLRDWPLPFFASTSARLATSTTRPIPSRW